MLKTVRYFLFICCLAVVLGLGGGFLGSASYGKSDNIVLAAFSPVSVSSTLDQVGGPAGAELKLGRPQSHRIEFLRGGAARVAIWDGSRYRPKVFTSVESKEGSRICLARTRGWTGGCLTIRSNGEEYRCRYLWNNGARGETSCTFRPMRAS